MNTDRNKNRDEDQKNTSDSSEKQPRSSAFNERSQQEEKSTLNPEEEADLEQQRKEALTERD